MLDGNHTGQALEQPPGSVTCEVKLPQDWQDGSSLRGPLPARFDDRRQFPRFHYRIRAIFQCLETVPTRSIPSHPHVVYTKDIARAGVDFLHSEEMFPGERGRIWLMGGMGREVEVVRCLRLNERCFQVGARFPATIEFKILFDLLNSVR